MKPPRFSVLLVFILAATSLMAAGNNGEAPRRFSQALTAEERTQAGLTVLTSDELASLDALVRRDLGTRTSITEAPTADDKNRTTFSQRLTADERRVTGLARLKAEQITHVDGLVDRFAGAALARTLLAPPAYLARTRHARAAEERNDPRKNIRGTMSLSYGWGSGGYSEKTGAMTVTYDDPAGRYSVTVGYAESHIKAPEGRGVYLIDPLDRR